MQKFEIPIQLRWSDMDQNRHVRHSAYYDFGAMARILCFSLQGLTSHKLEEMGIGPIAFREEAIFRKEINFEDKTSIDLEIIQATPNFSRWSIRHQIRKEDGKIASTITIDGAWINIAKRKLALPNEFIQHAFESFPRTQDFKWM